MMPNSFSNSSSTAVSAASSTPSLEELQLKAEPGSVGEADSPSALALRSINSRVLQCDPEQIQSVSTLPTLLILMIQSWSVDNDTMQRVLTSAPLRDAAQKLNRSTLAEHSAAPIDRIQHTANRKFDWVQMGSEGEQIFDASLKLNASDATDADYTHGVLQLFSEAKGTQDLTALGSITTGIGLALGGTTMTAARRDAMLGRVLDSADTSSAGQMAAMIHGMCNCFGYRDIHSEFLQAVAVRILGSDRSSPTQLAAMMQSLGNFLGGTKISPDNRDGLLHITLAGFSANRDQATVTTALRTLWLVLGGKDISRANRDAFLDAVSGRQLVVDFLQLETAEMTGENPTAAKEPR